MPGSDRSVEDSGAPGAVRRIVIVGRGTAGWMAAAALSRLLANGRREFTLVESDDIATIGVGEATIPPIRAFNALLDIPEAEFLRETMGTYKLGIEFDGWGGAGSYMHPFGAAGQDFHGIPFHQIWLADREGGSTAPITDYSMCAVAAQHGRFAKPASDDQTPLSHLSYAYHFDASLYAAYLRRVAERQGVHRHEGRVVSVDRDGDSGAVVAVRLADGASVPGDLFIDCSGFRALLIEEALNTGWEDWSRWLPMDRALAMPSERSAALRPFTRAIARPAGWQWQIPLQHRVGNGHVFASAFMGMDDAEKLLRDNVEGAALGDPRLLCFATGMRRLAWNHNVVSLGLSSGFIEPLESTSIHLVQHGILRLAALFPTGIDDAACRAEYNSEMRRTFEAVRDFVILHYKVNGRQDDPFWREMRDMVVPHSLQRRLDLWRSGGRLFRQDGDVFAIPSWAAVLSGQGMWPVGRDPSTEALGQEQVRAALSDMRTAYAQTACRLPTHRDYLQRSGAFRAPDAHRC